MGTHAEERVWNDPRFAPFFRGSRTFLRQCRKETHYGWPSANPVLTRLIDCAAYTGRAHVPITSESLEIGEEACE